MFSNFKKYLVNLLDISENLYKLDCLTPQPINGDQTYIGVVKGHRRFLAKEAKAGAIIHALLELDFSKIHHVFSD